jgi:CsoR family transcriptional regulator, copper-sensing transcriptional repressor
MNTEHKHQHQNTKKIIDRMSRAIGHMESIKRMVEEGRDCSEILIQISAVRSAINNVGKIILQDHINNCIIDAVKTGDKKVLEDLNSAVAMFMK